MFEEYKYLAENGNSSAVRPEDIYSHGLTEFNPQIGSKSPKYRQF
jgi:hypothetical protein